MTRTSSPVVTRPPSRRRGESATVYRSRIAAWERDRLEANGRGYRQISVPPGVSPMGRALLLSIAGLSFARGPEYHPIELSERIVAALLRLDGSRAHRQAHQVLDELLDLGVLVVEEPARGRRPGQYRLDVAPYVTSRRRAPEQKGHNRPLRPLSTGTSSPARPVRKKQKKKIERAQPSAPPAPISPSRVETGGAPPVSMTDDGSVSLAAFLASLPDDERKRFAVMPGVSLVQSAFGGGGPRAKEPKSSPTASAPQPSRDPAEHERRVREQAAQFRHEASEERRDSREKLVVVGASEAGSALVGHAKAKLLQRVGDPHKEEVCHVG